jgi:hypothetical protein
MSKVMSELDDVSNIRVIFIEFKSTLPTMASQLATFLPITNLYNDNGRSGIQGNFWNIGIEPITATSVALFHFFRDV